MNVIKIETDDSEDDELMTDHDSETDRNRGNKIHQKKKQVVQSKCVNSELFDSESSDSDNKGRSRNRKTGKGHPIKTDVKNSRIPPKMCTKKRSVKSGYPKVFTLENSDEEVAGLKTQNMEGLDAVDLIKKARYDMPNACPYCSKVLSRKDKLNNHIKSFHPGDLSASNIQINSIKNPTHTKISRIKVEDASTFNDSDVENKNLNSLKMCKDQRSSDMNGNSKMATWVDSDDEIVLGKNLSKREILNSDTDDTLQIEGEIQPELEIEIHNESNLKEENRQLKLFKVHKRVIGFQYSNSKEPIPQVESDAKNDPILASTRQDSLKAELVTQLKGDFKLDSEEKTEEEAHPKADDTKAEIIAQLKGDLKLESETDSEEEVHYHNGKKNHKKTKSGDSESDSTCLVVDLSKKLKRCTKNTKQTLAATEKESKENPVKKAKPVKKKTKKTFFANVNPENDAKIKTSSENFARAKYLVRQRRGFTREPLLEMGGFEDIFRKKLMRADIMKLSQSLDDGLINAVQMTDNMFEDSFEPEDVVVSVDPEEIVKIETPSDVKTDLNSPFLSEAEMDYESDTLEEKMQNFLKAMKPPESQDNIVIDKRKIIEDDLLERKMEKLVDLINSVGSDKCFERCWDKAVSKNYQKSMPSVQLEETARKFAEVQRKRNQLEETTRKLAEVQRKRNREHWLRTAGNVKPKNIKKVNNVPKKELPKPQVSFKPLKTIKFKIPRKSQTKKIWTKTAEMWRQALKVDENGCYKVNKDGQRVLCKSHKRELLDYKEFDFKEDTAKNSEIKDEVHQKPRTNRKAECSTPEQPLFTSSPKRLLSENGPLLTSSPRHLTFQPASPDFLLDDSYSSDTLAGNLSHLGEPRLRSPRLGDQTDHGKEEIGQDVLNYSMETRVPSPRNLYGNFVFKDLPKENIIDEGKKEEEKEENKFSNCGDDSSTKSIFSSMLKLGLKSLNVPKT